MTSISTPNSSEFQFHKGTIRTIIPTEFFEIRSIFQFHKGTIRTRYLLTYSCILPYFNSIKVQLELIILAVLCQSVEFQFHKGTIRTDFRLQAKYLLHHFNSIKVQLEHWHLLLFFDSDDYFNSIKVQLELDYFNGVLPTPQLFQFHKGTIRT